MTLQDARACQTCGDLLSSEVMACPRDGTPRGPDEQAQSTQTLLIQDDLAPRPIGLVAPSEPVLDTISGQRLGDYVVRHRLGSGGMGVVYAGEHVTLGSKVAIKFILEAHARGPHARDLLNEARAASAIRHRGIIDVFGFGQQADVGQYLIMEYLEGQPLSELIRQAAPLAPSVALPLLCEVLDALSAAHAVGVIHRDLKPSNIFVVRQSNGSEYIKVLDFGLAKRSSVAEGANLQTRSDLVVGTPQYMSPEQALCEAVSPRTDLYAVGVIAFELLTGRRPFTGRSSMEVVAHHIKSPPPAPSSLVALAPELDALVLRLLAKEPSRRPASASHVAEELRAMWPSSHSFSSRTSAPFVAVVKLADAVAPNERTATLSPPVAAPLVAQRGPIRSLWTWGALAGAVLASVSGVGVVMTRTSESPPSRESPLHSEAGGPSSARPLVHEPHAETLPLPTSAVVDSVLTSPRASVPATKPPRGAAMSTARKAVARSASLAVSVPVVPQASASPAAQPAPEFEATGVLHLSVRGAWADVVVDGQRLGRVPPQNRYPLTAGEHQLELRNPNLEVYRQRIVIPPHGTLSHPVDFTSAVQAHTVTAP